MSNEKPEVEVMIDLETLDTKEAAIIFQLGIVVFDDSGVIDKAEINIDIESQTDRTMSSDTILFHIKQSANESAGKDQVPMRAALRALNEISSKFVVSNYWAKGDFDYSLLNHAFEQNDKTPPWKFWQIRELRTLMDECGVKKGKVAHSALQDCLDQIDRLNECREIIKGGK